MRDWTSYSGKVVGEPTLVVGERWKGSDTECQVPDLSSNPIVPVIFDERT